MRIISKLTWALFFLIFGACTNTSDKIRKIPLINFFEDPQRTAFSISPDGNSISYLHPYHDRLNIFVQSVKGEDVIRLTSAEDRNIAYYFWANNDEILYLQDKNEVENQTLYAVRKDGTNERILIDFKDTKINLISTGRAANNEILVALNKRDSTVFDAYRLNIQTGKLVLLVKNPGNITRWVSDAKGRLRIAIASDEVKETLLYRAKEKEPFKALVTNNFKTSIYPIGFSEDDSCIYALSNQLRDKKALVELNVNTGKEHREIYSNSQVDVYDGVYSRLKKKMVFATYETWKKQRQYLDADVKQMFHNLEVQLPNTEIKITDRDSLESKFIVRTFTDRNPGTYYLYDRINNKLTKLSDLNTSFKEEEMCKMEAISYKSRDGLFINGYLTLPRVNSGRNLPVVVIPHGGPSGRNNWGYNAEVQFLANRGYAVFQVNYRGSTGYGKAFWIAGFKQWGGKMQDDITDGVNWLINEGVADPDRIAIYGSNFGGYSALHGLCFQPQLYACGASLSGITNLFTYSRSIPPYYKPYQRMIFEMVGNPETDADYFRAASPVFHTTNIKAPVLIAHGGKDPRINVNETNQFVKELKENGVPVIYIVKDDEGQYFRKQENKLEFYRQLETFLETNLKKR